MLLIDEVDRADDEFEAFLLEILSDYAVTVPELGTFRAEVPPVVVITSNRTRDVHDALKRRCLYHWVEHPDFEREVAIVRAAGARGARAPGPPGGGGRPSRSARPGMYKPPGVAETIDWAQALALLGRDELDEASVVGHARHRPQVPGGPGTGPPRRVGTAGRDGEAEVGDVTDPQPVLVGFVRALRDAGLSEPVGSTVAFVEAVGALAGEPRASLYWAGRATLVRRPEDIATYDRVFATFWRAVPANPADVLVETVTARARRRRGRRPIPIPATTRTRPTPTTCSPCASAPTRCCATRTSPPTTRASSTRPGGSWPTCA